MGRMLEICAETLDGCVAAAEGGADRVELCSALIVGGLTPSYGLIREAMTSSPIPIHVLLRPRGGDFLYSKQEFHVICHDLESAASLGASGIVAGILREDGLPDTVRMSKLVHLAAPLEVTFHRAFDHAARLSESLERVIDTGCRRLLTSGGAPTALQGLGTLSQLSKQANGRIRIAAGGGVNLQTAGLVLDAAEVDIHSSLRTSARPPGGGDPLWDEAAKPTRIRPRDVRDLAQLVHQPRREAPTVK